MTKEYKINLGLAESDFIDIREGGIKLHFLPNDFTEYKEKINFIFFSHFILKT